MSTSIKTLQEEPLLSPGEVKLFNTGYPRGVTQGRGDGKRQENISNRWYFVLSLHLSGKTYDEISELSGYAKPTISLILNDERVITLRQRMLHDIDKEFESLYTSVVQEIRFALQDQDPRIRLEAAEKWLKAHGKYQPKTTTQVNITAEDVVVQILNQYSGEK